MPLPLYLSCWFRLQNIRVWVQIRKMLFTGSDVFRFPWWLVWGCLLSWVWLLSEGLLVKFVIWNLYLWWVFFYLGSVYFYFDKIFCCQEYGLLTRFSCSILWNPLNIPVLFITAKIVSTIHINASWIFICIACHKKL